MRWVALSVLAAALGAQGSQADYERADGLRARWNGQVSRDSVRATWFADGEKFWYRNDLGDGGREFVVVDATKGERALAFDHDRLRAALSTALGEELETLPFRRIEFEGESQLELIAGGHRWTCDLGDYALTKGEAAEEPPENRRERRGRRNRGRRGRGGGRGPNRSPDGTWEAAIVEHDLVLRAADGSREYPLSHDGTAEAYYGNATWSPDGRHIVACKITPGDVADVYMIETSPDDQLDAKLHRRPYARPGDRFDSYEMHVFSVLTKEGLKADVEPIDFGRPRQLRWRDGNSKFTFYKRDRGHQRDRVIEVDVATGASRTLLDERAETFIDHYHKHYLEHVGDEILYTSERDGWNHLYRYDGVKGELINQVTKGEWLVRDVVRVDEEKRQIWFRASGMYADQDPYFIRYYRIDFDGGNLVTLTEGDGNHSVQFSPDHRFLIDTWSRVDQPPVSVLRRCSDGNLICELEHANIDSLLAKGWRAPEVYTAKGRDGETDIWGVVVRPVDFDENRSYPVLEYIYAGPHDSHVPKSFRAYHGMQAMAELGFVVVQIDGMGTNNRSKAFHDVCWQNLADAGFPDRIAWLRALGEKYAYLDLDRVGIYGTSAGGQNAMGAMLFHPEFYKAAVAACGCHDNRLDKASWNEQWMGFPTGPHYEAQSNVTNASKLRGELLLIVGELDTNVPFESTMRVVDALIEADRDFDLLVMPGMGHSSGGRYGTRRTRDFFVRHLLGREPRWTTDGQK